MSFQNAHGTKQGPLAFQDNCTTAQKHHPVLGQRLFSCAFRFEKTNKHLVSDYLVLNKVFLK
jgi:hypothetical protein